MRLAQLAAVLAVCLIAAAHAAAPAAADYVPPAEVADWERVDPAKHGLDPVKLRAAVRFAMEHETQTPEDLRGVLEAENLPLWVPLQFAREAFSSPVGPLEPRSAANGIVLKDGYIVAEWGPTEAVDMTFSVTKTFLSALAGVALDRGLIDDLDDRVLSDIVAPEWDDPHNAPITWDMMLRQTSGWKGTLFGKPWWADRPGSAEEPAWHDLAAGAPTPGSAWEYNDVRVNALSLALTRLFGRPLPEVLDEAVMDPIGASDRWVWHGYETSYIDLDGEQVQVPAGGGHWGGGMFIDAYDLARLGLLALRKGRWDGTQVLSDGFVRQAMTPTALEPGYGFMNWFLNTDRERFPQAREDTVVFYGSGTNMVYVDYEHDLVAVVRWIENADHKGFVDLLHEAVR